MKKQNYFAFFVLFVTGLTFYSCSEDKLQSGSISENDLNPVNITGLNQTWNQFATAEGEFHNEGLAYIHNSYLPHASSHLVGKTVVVNGEKELTLAVYQELQAKTTQFLISKGKNPLEVQNEFDKLNEVFTNLGAFKTTIDNIDYVEGFLDFRAILNEKVRLGYLSQSNFDELEPMITAFENEDASTFDNIVAGFPAEYNFVNGDNFLAGCTGVYNYSKDYWANFISDPNSSVRKKQKSQLQITEQDVINGMFVAAADMMGGVGAIFTSAGAALLLVECTCPQCGAWIC